MIGRKILEIKNVPLSEVVDILGKVPEEELGFEQVKTFDYAKKINKLQKEKAGKLIEELMTIEKIDHSKAVKIADILPRNEAEVRIMFVKEIYSLTEEEVAKILEIVRKYV